MRLLSRGFPESWSPVLCAALAMGLALLATWQIDDFALDDAWIHLSYAKSLSLGEGLSYNPHDHEAGCTSPLWVFMLWLWPTGRDPFSAVRLLEILLHGLTAFAASAWTLAHGRRIATVSQPVPLAAISLLAGGLVACLPLSLHGVASGMEVPLATCLTLAVGWAVWSERPGWAGLFGALGMWTRPEFVVWTAALASAAWLARSPGDRSLRRGAIWALTGSVTAAGLWSLWLLVTVDVPLPNGFFVKGRGTLGAGWDYLSAQVLPWQPWLVGLGGVPLLGLELLAESRRRTMAGWMLIGASMVPIAAIALSRPLHPSIPFFEARYFVPFLAAPLILVAFGLARVPRWVGAALLLPIAWITGQSDLETGARIAAAARDTRLLHTDVATWVSSHLPRDAVIAVEGAGALRYHTPRTMEVVDLVGLNDHVAAQLHFDRDAKICHWVARRPDYAAVPGHWVGLLSAIFATEPLARFDDPDYHQVEPSRPASVEVMRLGALTPRWRDCASASDGSR